MRGGRPQTVSFEQAAALQRATLEKCGCFLTGMAQRLRPELSAVNEAEEHLNSAEFFWKAVIMGAVAKTFSSFLPFSFFLLSNYIGGLMPAPNKSCLILTKLSVSVCDVIATGVGRMSTSTFMPGQEQKREGGLQD